VFEPAARADCGGLAPLTQRNVAASLDKVQTNSNATQFDKDLNAIIVRYQLI
jgi:hypothetical protein